ncbi:MAG: SDR family oxidoreductase [Sphingobacteriales bacterium]|nr:MAG: SDR family oxidoreductase [Sphingobacteriales bacterium]
MKILITGGASGLGEAITRRLALDNTNAVIFTYNKSVEQAARIQEQFANASGIHCDFSKREDIISLCNSISSMDPGVLINNAMTGFEQQYFHKLDPVYFSDSFEKNIMPVIMLSQAAIKAFRKNKSGKIITILSSAILDKPPVGWSEYTASKCYLHSLAKSWATENAAFNITANCISPSFMQTSLTAGTDERLVEDMKNKHPLKSILTVGEVAEAVAFYVGASQHINGTNLVLNAGQNVI